MKKIVLIVIAMVTISFAQNRVEFETVTVDSADSTFVVDLGLDANQLQPNYSGGNDFRPILLITDTAMTSTAVNFLISADDGTTYADTLYEKDGTKLSYSVGPSRAIILKPIDFAGVRYFQAVLDSTEADTRTIKIGKRQY